MRFVAALTMSMGLLAGGAWGAPGEAEKAASGVEAARQYIKLLVSGQGVKAVDEFWDIDAFLGQTFGEAMKNLPADQLARTRQAMLDILHTVVSNPKGVEALAKARLSELEGKDAGDGRVRVTFTATLGDRKVENALLLARRKEGWKIIDAGNNNRMLTDTFRLQYEKYTKVAGSATPLEFVESVARDMKEKSSR